MKLVTISGAYGAGGSVIGPALAERLGVPFLDRAIPARVADELDVPLEEAAAYDEHASAGWIERLLEGFAATDGIVPGPLPTKAAAPEQFRRATEEVMLRQAATGEGVILGRAGMIVLRDRPDVLRVRLDGSPEARAAQAMKIAGIDLATARRHVLQQDRTHEAYIGHFYGADIHDCTLYHVVLDSPTLGTQRCVDALEVLARESEAPEAPEALARES